MEEQLLKGNFKVKHPVKQKPKKDAPTFLEEYKKKAMGSIGGSMVYMERGQMTWDGDQ